MFSLKACNLQNASHEVTVQAKANLSEGSAGGKVNYQYTAAKIEGCANKECPDRQPGGFNAPSKTQTNSKSKN